MDKVAENLISGLAGLAAGYIAAEGYKQFVSHSAKKSWEDDIGIHHGEAKENFVWIFCIFSHRIEFQY